MASSIPTSWRPPEPTALARCATVKVRSGSSHRVEARSAMAPGETVPGASTRHRRERVYRTTTTVRFRSSLDCRRAIASDCLSHLPHCCRD